MIEPNCDKPFKEAVCVDVMRVFDSCCTQECLEDLEFSFNATDQDTINSALYIKAKCIEVTGATFTIDPVPFNKGFYTVDVTFTFKAEVEVYVCSCNPPVIVYGTASFSKKVILYGSDGSTQRFISNGYNMQTFPSHTSGCSSCCDNGSLPIAAVNVAPPMCLDAKLIQSCNGNIVSITIGIFAIIQLERPVPIMIPAYDYCVPEKECSTNTDSPCELFDKIKFPTSEFFPKGLDNDETGNCGCMTSSSQNDKINE